MNKYFFMIKVTYTRRFIVEEEKFDQFNTARDKIQKLSKGKKDVPYSVAMNLLSCLSEENELHTTYEQHLKDKNEKAEKVHELVIDRFKNDPEYFFEIKELQNRKAKGKLGLSLRPQTVILNKYSSYKGHSRYYTYTIEELINSTIHKLVKVNIENRDETLFYAYDLLVSYLSQIKKKDIMSDYKKKVLAGFIVKYLGFKICEKPNIRNADMFSAVENIFERNKKGVQRKIALEEKQREAEKRAKEINKDPQNDGFSFNPSRIGKEVL